MRPGNLKGNLAFRHKQKRPEIIGAFLLQG